MHMRLDGKLAWLYLMLISQVLIVMIYVVSTPTTEIISATTQTPVSFVKFASSKAPTKYQTITHRSKPAFKTPSNSILLKDTKTIKYFRFYNQTRCFSAGVDERRMLSDNDFDRCSCSVGWHGSDCGQPEVAWRAIMASKHSLSLKLRRSTRRLIYVFCLSDFDSDIAEATVEELHQVVDLFVVCDFSTSEGNFKHRLSKGLLSAHHHKILYINSAKVHGQSQGDLLSFIWIKLNHVVKSLRNDDIFAMAEAEQILNSRALMFLKMYDGWPQPIGFRLRWSVFGFYWQHPLKTTIVIGACTVDLVREHVSSKSSPFLRRQELETERESPGLVLGDLNHYGGWYCHYCQSPANIVSSLAAMNFTAEGGKIVDVPFVEDIIGGGLWIDGKTNLLRSYRSRETYFAPSVILNETWKYDWLLENFYAKLDYY